MKIKKIATIFLIFIAICTTTLATQEEILSSQSETLNIKQFVSEADKYTKEVFEDIDMNTLLNDAIKGKINNSNIITKIIGVFSKEVKQTIAIIRKYYSYNCYT